MQVEEEGRTRRRRERRPEARLANTKVNRTAGKTPSTWMTDSAYTIFGENMGTRYCEEAPASRQGQCREVFPHARGEFLTGKGRSLALQVLGRGRG